MEPVEAASSEVELRGDAATQAGCPSPVAFRVDLAVGAPRGLLAASERVEASEKVAEQVADGWDDRLEGIPQGPSCASDGFDDAVDDPAAEVFACLEDIFANNGEQLHYFAWHRCDQADDLADQVDGEVGDDEGELADQRLRSVQDVHRELHEQVDDEADDVDDEVFEVLPGGRHVAPEDCLDEADHVFDYVPQ